MILYVASVHVCFLLLAFFIKARVVIVIRIMLLVKTLESTSILYLRTNGTCLNSDSSPGISRLSLTYFEIINN